MTDENHMRDAVQAAPVAWRYRNPNSKHWIIQLDKPTEASPYVEHGAEIEALYNAAQPPAAPVETVAVPKAALDWLFGSAAAPDGNWFSDDEDTEIKTPRKYSRKYWWRSRFSDLIKNCGAESNRHSGAVGTEKRAEQSNPGGGHVTEPDTSHGYLSDKPLPDEPTPAAGGLSRLSAANGEQSNADGMKIDREYEAQMNPIDDAEFGMKP